MKTYTDILKSQLADIRKLRPNSDKELDLRLEKAEKRIKSELCLKK